MYGCNYWNNVFSGQVNTSVYTLAPFTIPRLFDSYVIGTQH